MKIKVNNISNFVITKYKKHPFVYTILLICLIICLIFVFSNIFKQKATYMTIKAGYRNISNQVFATGTLAGSVEVDVGAQVSGQIKKLYVKSGDRVKAGDLLCEIDPEIQENNLQSAKLQEAVLEAQIASKQAQLISYSQEYTRQKALYKIDGTSKQQLELAKANFDMATADLKALNAQLKIANIAVLDAGKNLSYTKITAPMDGTIYAMAVEEGQTVNANQSTPTILRMALLDPMIVETEISEADVVKIKPGMQASFTILGMPNKVFKSKLISVDVAPQDAKYETNTTKSTSSTTDQAIYYNAILQVDNPEGILRIDMTAQVSIDIANANNVLSIPISALNVDNYNQGSVYTYNDGILQEHKVGLGIRDEQYVQITSGISIDDNIVIGDDVQKAQMLSEQNANVPPHLRGRR